jgi:superfamily II DNA or RNA helicase
MSALFPDQLEALAKVDQAFADGFRAPLLVAATGFGKTHCAVEVIRRENERGRTVWFLAHLAELLDDTAARLASRGMPHGWIRSGMRPDLTAPCQLVSLRTAVSRLAHLPRPGLIIIDECDLAVAPSYQLIVDNWLERPRLLGLTGTPIRLDGRPMRSAGFDHLIATPDTIDLIDAGRLSPLKMWSFDPPSELDRVRNRGGDVDPVESGRIMAANWVIADVFGNWQRICAPDGPGGEVRPTAIFCPDVASAESYAADWRAAGYRAMAVHSNSSTAERTEAVTGLREGRLDAVACADLWIAGVDVARIACVLCVRKTESVRIWLQMNGRGLRVSDEWPDCYLLDAVANLPRLRSPLARRMHLWQLDGPPMAPGGGAPRLPPVLICQVCRSCDVVGRRCRECGHEQEVRLPHGPRVVEGELIEIDPRAALEAGRPAKPARAMDPETVRSEARSLMRQAKDEAWPDQRIIRELTALGERAQYNNPRGWAYLQIGFRQKWRLGAGARRVAL